MTHVGPEAGPVEKPPYGVVRRTSNLTLRPLLLKSVKSEYKKWLKFTALIQPLFSSRGPELEGGPTRGAEEPSYYVRLGTLSTRLRRRAYSRAVARVRDAKQRSQEAVSRLHHSVNLVGFLLLRATDMSSLHFCSCEYTKSCHLFLLLPINLK